MREMKRRETDPASNQFPKCFPQSGPLRDVHGVIHREEEREEVDRGGQEDKRGK